MTAGLAPAIMVQGTASSVGKSLLVTALCRFFRQEGLRVLPFKSQNMALNSAVAADGGEIGRAQAVQAEAAGVPAAVDMNPILIKPEADARSQIVVLGKPAGSLTAAQYHDLRPALAGVIAGCLDRLRRACDLLVIEGAGSPAEINLKAHEIVNMHVARAASARVLLVGDIDRGGVFAAFVGTMELLAPEERALVGGFVVNKFRGDLGLLRPGLDFLTDRTGVPVLGVLPWLADLRLPDEDSQSLEMRRALRRADSHEIDVAVVRLPRMANFDDFDPLEREEGVALRFVQRPGDAEGADLLVLPGSKSTVSDLDWIRRQGFADAILARAARAHPVLGICGGCQMLGAHIDDPSGVESRQRSVQGLGLLPIRTRFAQTKITARVRARAAARTFLTERLGSQDDIAGYEIHMGVLEPVAAPSAPVFEIVQRNSEPTRTADGAVSANGAVVGTLLHGILENPGVRAGLLDFLRRRRGLPARAPAVLPSRDAVYDRLASAVREHIDLRALRRLAGVPGRDQL